MSEDAVVSAVVRAGVLQQWVDTFTPLVDEGKVHFNEDGFRVLVVDSGNVAGYIPVELSATAFEHYEAPGEVVMGMPFHALDDRLGPANDDDLAEFRIDMETRKFRLSYRNIDQALAMIDADNIRAEPDDPGLDLPNTVTLEGRDLREVWTVSDMVSDHFEIRGSPDDREVRFVADGDIDDSVLTYGDEEVIEADVTEPVESYYSLGYFDSMTKPIPADAEVTLTFGNDFPLLLDWTACDGDLDARGMIAPRIKT